MKKLITLFTILLFSFSFAQFNPESGTKTNNTVKIESKTYPIYKTNKGTEYICLTSPKTHNKYAVWLGTPTSKTYQGKQVRKTKKGKSFILVMSKNSGNPYPKYLK